MKYFFKVITIGFLTVCVHLLSYAENPAVDQKPTTPSEKPIPKKVEHEFQFLYSDNFSSVSVTSR